MNEKQIETVIGLLSRIAIALESQVRALGPIEPNLVRPLSEYAAFDWSSIGARVVQSDPSDPSGPTHVEHDGALYTRRSPQNKYGAAIWFSRSVGRDEEGGTQYIRLITFKPLGDADPLPASVKREMAYTLPVEAGESTEPAADRSPIPAPPARKVEMAQRQPASPPANPAAQAAPTPPAQPAQSAPVLTGMARYVDLAASKKFNITRDIAWAIAHLVDDDLERAEGLLPFFAECKASGADFESGKQILLAAGGDPQQAAFQLRDLLAQPGALKSNAASVSQKDYLVKAHDYSIEEAGANAIAHLVDGDYTRAVKLLPFFAHCKTRGITKFSDARRILEACNGDPITATRKVESDIDEKARAKVATPRPQANQPAAR